MIDVSYEEAVAQIHKETGLSLAEIQSRVQAKLQQLAGLISRDGAVHILANELGIQLVRQAPTTAKQLKIKEVSLQSRNITVAGRVVQKYDPRSFNKNGREGRVASLLLGDETGVTRVVFWNDQVDVFNQLTQGDILVVQNPFVKQSYQADRLELQLNTQSSLVVNPEGVSIAQRQTVERAPSVQKYIKDLQNNDENIEIIATIVQVYDPRFFDACPQCNKKLIGENQCAEHGEVVPNMNFSMSAFLDDGTGNVRTTFWKQQAVRLTRKTENDFRTYKDDPAAFEEVKNDLLGEFVKVVGKVKRNDTFDRLELTANLVTLDVDPAKELENLQKKFEVPKDKPDDLSVVDDVISLEDLEDLKG